LAALRPLLEKAVATPPTINHCDFRLQNAAQRADGSLVLFDWDDSLVGPAGMSLHNCFSGCLIPCSLLLALPYARQLDTRHGELLEHYVQALVDGTYANRKVIESALPGAIVAGVMTYLMSYGKFPLDYAEDREVIGDIIRRRTDDLLALCDEILMTDPSQVQLLVASYEDEERGSQACRLLKTAIDSGKSNLEHYQRLTRLLLKLEKTEDAEAVCQAGLQFFPAAAQLRELHGYLAMQRMEFAVAIDSLQLAQSLDPALLIDEHLLGELRFVRDHLGRIDQPDVVPTVRLSEHDSSSLRSVKLRLAVKLFSKHGALVLENAFQPKLLDQLNQQFTQRYWPELQGGQTENSLKVGNGRYMMTIELVGAFNSPELYASPFLMDLLSQLLGDEFVLGSLTAVASMPGSPDMRMHKDHPALFPAETDPAPRSNFAITTLLPLLGFDPRMGTTRIVKGSQRLSSTESAKLPYQDPIAPAGACLLMDYRLSHQGLANQSDRVRPVMSLVYSRPWFRDAANFSKQPRLSIGVDEFLKIPEDHRRLFSWLFQLETSES
jgi:hypothetical protein